jgi:hypothetical protein
VASTYGGAAATRLIDVFLRRDPANSADGRLTARALEFATKLGSDELPVDQAGTWILERVCRPTGLGTALPNDGGG